MQAYRYKDLSIVSGKKPENSHLWWEINSSGIIYLIDSTANNKLYKTTDKGDNWSLIDDALAPIRGGWHDRDNDELWLVGDTNDDLYVYKVDLTNDNVSTEATELGFDEGYAYDIFKIGGTYYVLGCEGTGVILLDYDLVVWEVNTVGNSLDEIDDMNYGVLGYAGDCGYAIVVGTNAYFLVDLMGVGLRLIKFDSTGGTLSNEEDIAGYSLNSNLSLCGIAYDGSQYLYFTVNKDADSKNYVMQYEIGGSETELAELNLALMMDRNCSNTVPSEYEKGFSTTTEITYEIKPKRGGIIQLQDISDLSDANIIAQTDHYLMNNDKDMFEYTNIEEYISSITIQDGILGIKKWCSHTCHPNYNGYWNEGDSIKIYDDNDVLCFWGKILIPQISANTGLTTFTAEGFANEMYNNTYEKSYSADDTDTKQKDLIDNAFYYNYRSSSIEGTTTTYDYKYNRACVYLFYLARFLERQVCRIEPDGLIVTEAYNSITATGKSWTLNDRNQNVFLIDIPKFKKDTIQGYYKGNLGITSVVVRYKDNATATRPASPSELTNKKRLNEFRDPKLEASTEANQLGDNLYNIFSADTIFLGLRIEGQGWLQPGKSIEIQATDQIAITQAHFLILSTKYDPKNDIHTEMILTDNIVFPFEFKSNFNTTPLQTHTAVVQSLENQANIGGSSNTYLEYDDDDPAAWDIDEGDFTIDSTWRELDLDAFKTVPSDVIGCWARVKVQDANTNMYFGIRATSQANTIQVVSVYTQVANQAYTTVMPIPLDALHKFDYYITTGMDQARVTVLWWIRKPGG